MAGWALDSADPSASSLKTTAMLTWFRAHAPVATAIVVFVVGSGDIASHTAHAAPGAPVVVEHDATAHRMSTAAFAQCGPRRTASRTRGRA